MAVLGLTAAFLWGAVGISNTQERINGFARLAVPGATTVSVTEPGIMVVYHESAAEVARYAEPTANGRPVTRWDPGTRTIVTVSYPSKRPDLAAARAAGDRAWRHGRAGRHLPARYDVEPGRAGRAVATFQAATAGPYRVSTARASEAGATLAVGGDITRSLALTTQGAVVLGLVTVLVAVPLAVATYRARSRTLR